MGRRKLLCELTGRQLERRLERAMSAVLYALPPDADFLLVVGADNRHVITGDSVDPDNDACAYLRAALEECRINTVENN